MWKIDTHTHKIYVENGKKICAENNEGKKMLGSVLQIQCLWFCRVKISHVICLSCASSQRMGDTAIWSHNWSSHSQKAYTQKIFLRPPLLPPHVDLISSRNYTRWLLLCSLQSTKYLSNTWIIKNETPYASNKITTTFPNTNESDNKSSFAAYHHNIELFLSEDKKVRKIFTVPTHHELYC